MYRLFFKRVIDIVISGVAMIILTPIFVILAICVRISMGTPILFSQNRIGKGEIPFKLYKFRSMTNECDTIGHLLPEEKRVTKIGAIIRSSSLDELPELFAIFKGDMSFVGPRPLRMDDLPYFYEEERVRHTVRGGLIPPDSLSGKVFTTYEEQFQYEAFYAKNVSLLLDFKIVIKTFNIIVKRLTNDYGNDFRPHLKEYRLKQINHVK
jgi:undecaprenyl phosphate N,N'-diacetylbacillosamine 1-phosphate transferase